MRNTLLCAAVVFSFAGLMPAQSFECQPLGPFPGACCTDCEDAWSNNVGTGTGVDAIPACGMPAGGTQFARATAEGFATPSGSGIPRPLPFGVTEIRVIVPDGADGVSFKWNWFNDEAGGTASLVGSGGRGEGSFNDGFEIALVAADEATVLLPLVYVDTFSSLAPGGCIDVLTLGADVLSDGVETFAVAFAPVPFGSYLSIVSFNGGDTAEDSSGVVDCIAWGEPAAPSYELGDPSGPRVIDLTPATSYRLGQPTSIRMDAGLPFLEGRHCMVAQVYDFSSQGQFVSPGIAGPLFIRAGRPVAVLSEGLLTGGVNPGRGPIVTFTPTDSSLCGVGIVVQAYVITEQLTNPTWTTALFGWVR